MNTPLRSPEEKINRLTIANEVFAEYMAQTKTPEEKAYTNHYLKWLKRQFLEVKSILKGGTQ